MVGMNWWGGGTGGPEDSGGIKDWSLEIPWPGKDTLPHLLPSGV